MNWQHVYSTIYRSTLVSDLCCCSILGYLGQEKINGPCTVQLHDNSKCDFNFIYLNFFGTACYRMTLMQLLSTTSGTVWRSKENVRWTSSKTECLQLPWQHESVGSSEWCTGWWYQMQLHPVSYPVSLCSGEADPIGNWNFHSHDFRSQEQQYHRWYFCSLEHSLPNAKTKTWSLCFKCVFFE